VSQAADPPAAPPAAEAADPSLAHLFGRLRLVEARVRLAVQRRRAVDPEPDDRFRGLYISDAHVDQLLHGTPQSPSDPLDPSLFDQLEEIEAAGAAEEAAGAEVRLRRLARSFQLTAEDIDILLVALAPDLDPRFERLYAYLQDDVSRRRASTGLALELSVVRSGVRAARARLHPSAPVVAGGLLLVEEGDRPFLTRSLRVPDRVTAHLLHDDTPDPQVQAVLAALPPVPIGDVDPIRRTRARGARLWYIRESPGAASVPMAVAGMDAAGLPSLIIDLARLTGSEDALEVAAAAVREARLLGGGLVASPIDALGERPAPAIRALAEAPCPVVLVGSRAWDPAWTAEVPVLIQAPMPSVADRNRLWREALNGYAAEEADPGRETAPFRLTPEQVQRAAKAARLQAAAQETKISPAHLLAGARAQNAAGLERLSRRIEPQVTWADVVLPPDAVQQLRELTDRARHRERVFDDWGMAAHSSKGRSLTALFAGDSGTGKTMSAEVVAGDLGLDLYVIDLSTVVDKYIGETEKNLDRIFVEADRVNGVLLFDEADAIFGKRSEVKDARDRYANVEIAYLLQRMELFDGLAILTTNLRANVDEAFLRRLDVIADFPMPEEDDRLRLWQLHLRSELPRSDEIDLEFLAEAFKLSGGNIRNICLAAAFLAAAEDRRVSMTDLVRATEREYQKLGRMIHVSEFGRYFELLHGRPS
jgi:AAA+ superfamily predicted ATPase